MIFENTRSAARALYVNKLRSSLTILGIMIGVGAVIAMVAVGSGAQERLTEQIQSLGTNLVLIRSSSTSIQGVRGGAGTRATLTDEDAMAIQEEIAAVQAAAPSRGPGARQVIHGNLNWGTGVIGVTPEWFEVKEWPVTDGRPITLEDHSAAAKVVVLGHTVASNLFGDDNPIGATIRISRIPFTVVGLLDVKGQNTSGQDQDDVVVVPLSTARRKLFGRIPGQARAVWVIIVKLRQGEDRAEAESQIRDLLRQRHRLQPHSEDDFDLHNPYDAIQTQEAASQTMVYLLGAIASVALLVGGIGIMNIMLVSVTERTREIGLRMAVGARRRDILNQFLIEAVTLSVIGGVLGIAVGLSGSHTINYFAEWRTLIGVEVIIIAFGFAVAVGVVFGFYPARKAAHLDPVEALRYE
jgi:putative ABC transport system permease protein